MTTTEDITELRIASEGHQGTITAHGNRITKLEKKTTTLTEAMAKMQTTQAVTNTKLNILIGLLSVIGVAVLGAVIKYLQT